MCIHKYLCRELNRGIKFNVLTFTVEDSAQNLFRSSFDDCDLMMGMSEKCRDYPLKFVDVNLQILDHEPGDPAM